VVQQINNIVKGAWKQSARENILDLRGKKLQEAEVDCIMRSFINCTLHERLLE
jgi:hypothetical protein